MGMGGTAPPWASSREMPSGILRGSLERKPEECGELRLAEFLPHRAQVEAHTIPMAGELRIFNSMPPVSFRQQKKTAPSTRQCVT